MSGADEPRVVLKVNLHKSRVMCKWKAESWAALLEAHYGIRFVPDITDYALMDDFMGSMHVNRKLAGLVEKAPRVCVVGDNDGVVGMVSLLTGAQHVALVHCGGAVVQDRVARNMRGFLAEAAVCCAERGYAGYPGAVHDGEELQGVSLHNRYPWQFMKHCPAKHHFDVVVWQNVWNRGYLQKMRAMQGNTRAPDADLANDLTPYEAEATHAETLHYLDEFIAKPMKQREVTCTVIVLRLRGRLTDEDWRASPLAADFALRFQLEEFPNERSERLAYDERGNVVARPDLDVKGAYRRVPDRNGGILGQYFSVVLQAKSRAKTPIPACVVTRYARDAWYGPYMFCRDAQRQGMYVLTASQHKPFVRLLDSAAPLTVVLEDDVMPNTDLAGYAFLPTLRRKIEAQIEDLVVFGKLFYTYLSGARKLSPDERRRAETRIKEYIECFENGYKIDDNSRQSTQVNYDDPEEVASYGVRLVRMKRRLFTAVHVIARLIERKNKWGLPKVTHGMHVKRLRPDEVRKLHRFKTKPRRWGGRRTLRSAVACEFALATNTTLGDPAQNYDADYWAFMEEEVNWEDEWNELENGDDYGDMQDAWNDLRRDRRWDGGGYDDDDRDDEDRGGFDFDDEDDAQYSDYDFLTEEEDDDDGEDEYPEEDGGKKGGGKDRWYDGPKKDEDGKRDPVKRHGKGIGGAKAWAPKRR